jgi:hypothetical protein
MLNGTGVENPAKVRGTFQKSGFGAASEGKVIMVDDGT